MPVKDRIAFFEGHNDNDNNDIDGDEEEDDDGFAVFPGTSGIGAQRAKKDFAIDGGAAAGKVSEQQGQLYTSLDSKRLALLTSISIFTQGRSFFCHRR